MSASQRVTRFRNPSNGYEENVGEAWAVGYLNLINKDGSATYVSGDLAVTVNAKGVVQPPSDRPAGGDCFGKTLKELRAAASWSLSQSVGSDRA